MKKVVVDPELFEQFPTFRRGILIVADVENRPANPAIERLLADEIARKAGTRAGEHEYVKAWEAAHLAFQSNPNKFPPAIKSLLKRIDKGGTLPFVNSVVALFNYISIKYLIPCGGDDVDAIEGHLHLGYARGDERFVPLGGTEVERPQPGEVIYYDDRTLEVMCRKWNWRNGDFSKIGEATKRIVINVDGIGPVPRAVVEEARDQMAALLAGECAASVTTGLLNRDQPEILLPFA